MEEQPLPPHRGLFTFLEVAAVDMGLLRQITTIGKIWKIVISATTTPYRGLFTFLEVAVVDMVLLRQITNIEKHDSKTRVFVLAPFWCHGTRFDTILVSWHPF